MLSNLAADTDYEVRVYCTNQWGRSDLSRTVLARTKSCKYHFMDQSRLLLREIK